MSTHPGTAGIPRPTPPETIIPRTVRVPTRLWHDVSELAASEGLSVSEVVRHYLQVYLDTAPRVRAGGE